MITLRFLPVCSVPLQASLTKRFFAQANDKVAKTKAKPSDALSRALNDEYQFEKERYTEFTEGLEFIKSSGFTLLESPENAEIKLVKNLGDKIVEIKYQASELANEDEEGDAMDEEGKDDKSPEKESNTAKSRADFNVVVKRSDGSGMIFTCSSESAEMNIFNVTYSKKVDDLMKEDSTKNVIPYLGPSFENLDEKVQKAFYEYLESLGLSDKLLAFIECSSIDKEQRMYMDWLQSINDFVKQRKN